MTAVSFFAAAVLPLWFCADFDSSAELNGRRVEIVIPAGRKTEGRFGQGYEFVSSKKRCEKEFLNIRDPELLKTFPASDGAFACWFRTADTNAPMGAAFSFGGFWDFRWGWDGEVFRINNNRRHGKLKFNREIGKSPNWRHFAATWSERGLYAYLDGEEILCREKINLSPLEPKKGDVLRFGAGTEWRTNPACGFVMDEIAVFSRALTPSEIKSLSTGKKPLREAAKVMKMEEFDYFGDIPAPDSLKKPMVFSWGGSGTCSLDFSRRMGINTISVSSLDTARARDVAKAGFGVNLRFENSTDWQRIWGGAGDVKERAYAVLAPYRTLKAWRGTLFNSEVYTLSHIMRASSNALWRAWAEKDSGGKVDFNILYPPRVDYKTLGIKPCKGVLPDDFTTLKTLLWAFEKGHPVAYVNELNRNVVKNISPDNLVWSEPSPSSRGLDMIADWMYDYSTDDCLQDFRTCYAKARERGVKFMPTFGGSYHGIWGVPAGIHPTAKDKKGKPLKISLAPSCDEMKIKCWMALASVPVDAVSFWNDAGWEDGAEKARAFSTNRTLKVGRIAEVDFIDRFGPFMHNEFLPALDEFAGVPNATAPIALLKPDELQYAGTERWTYYKYSCLIGRTLAKGPVAFDVLSNGDINVKNLKKYKYVILPLGNVLLKKHYDALYAVKDTTKVVTDLYCKLDFPNRESIPMKFDDNNKNPNRYAVTTEPLFAWLEKRKDELRAASFAWSDRDGIDAYTFVKEFPDGKKAVIVVNNAREDRSLWPGICDEKGYRPVAAANRITVHFNLPDGKRAKTFDFKPAETKIFRFEK